MKIDLMQILPEYFREILEFRELMKTDQDVLAELETNIEQIRKNFYIQTADESTLAQKEALFDIFASPGETVEYRRQRLLQKYNTIPAGRWCVSNGLANYELGNWFCEVIEYDDAYKTFTACSYEKDKKYFYRGRKVLHEWLGWEKYTPVS